MGGKRPDQRDIDPAERSSTEPGLHGEGRRGDARVDDNERKPNSGAQKGEPSTPSAEEHRPEPGGFQGKKGSGATPKREDQSRNDDDRKIDEAGEESFPASDPPAY